MRPVGKLNRKAVVKKKKQELRFKDEPNALIIEFTIGKFNWNIDSTAGWTKILEELI